MQFSFRASTAVWHASTAVWRALMAAGACALAFPAAASAQTGDVTVNPAAAGSSTVLLYPGGGYARVVPDLLMPGQKNGPIHLHMPSRRRVHVATAAPAPDTAPAPVPAAPRPRRKPVQVASAAPPPPAPSKAAAPASKPLYANGYPEAGAAGLFGGQSLTLTPNTQSGAPNTQSGAPPAQVARANPPAPDTSVAGLSKRSVILFAKGAPDPVDSAMGAIKLLASDLNKAMISPASRIELQAYGGDRGDKSSDARRLSLKRALAIRQVLIDDGVSADRIDVHAMGGVDDTGPADRVDVLVKS